MPLSPKQEPKYTTNDKAIVNRATGEEIPADEPVFILRARDRHAVNALLQYADACDDPEHTLVVLGRVEDFRKFADDHPNRMKEPDTEIK